MQPGPAPTGAPLAPEAIAELPLLQQTTRPYAWRQWFDSLGMKVPRDMTGPRLELFSMLAQAAEHQMGMALIPPFLIQRELAEGRLVIAHPHAYRSETQAYYLMIPERKSNRRRSTPSATGCWKRRGPGGSATAGRQAPQRLKPA